jgi:hypothetical protein
LLGIFKLMHSFLICKHAISLCLVHWKLVYDAATIYTGGSVDDISYKFHHFLCSKDGLTLFERKRILRLETKLNIATEYGFSDLTSDGVIKIEVIN